MRHSTLLAGVLALAGASAAACEFETNPDAALRSDGPRLEAHIAKCAASGFDFSAPLADEKVPFREIVAAKSAPKAVEAMLQAGADPNTVDKWGSPAFVDAVNFAYDRDDRDFLKVIDLLGTAGAEFSRPDNHGQLALSMATGTDANKLVAVLLKHGADPNGLNTYNRTPLFASVFGTCNPEGGDMLLAAGASLSPMPADQVDRMFNEAQEHCASTGKGRKYIKRLESMRP